MRTYAPMGPGTLFSCLSIATGPKALEVGSKTNVFSDAILRYGPENSLLSIDTFNSEYAGQHDARTYDVPTDFDMAEALRSQHPRRYTFKSGDPIGHLAKLPKHTYDWAFVNHSHDRQTVTTHLAATARVIKPAGIIACHGFANHEDAQRAGMEVVEGVQDFLSPEGEFQIYGLMLSTYPTVLLSRKSAIDSPFLETRLNGLANPLDDDPFDKKDGITDITLHQRLSREGSLYVVRHTVQVDDEVRKYTTTAQRRAPGYHQITSTQLA